MRNFLLGLLVGSVLAPAVAAPIVAPVVAAVVMAVMAGWKRVSLTPDTIATWQKTRENEATARNRKTRFGSRVSL